MQDGEKMVFSLTDRLNRKIELMVNVDYEFFQVSVKEGPYDKEVYYGTFYYWFPH